MYFPAKRLALIVRERPKSISHVYLSIGLTKRGDNTFWPIKPSIELWMLCGPLAPQTDWTYSSFPGLTEALTLIWSLYIFLYFLMNA